MNSNFEYSFKIHVDRKEGESHLEAFRRAFVQAMKDMGKSASDIATFEKLAQDLDAGRVKLDEVDKESRELYETWKRLSSVAADKDLLGIHHYQEIREESEATRAPSYQDVHGIHIPQLGRQGRAGPLRVCELIAAVRYLHAVDAVHSSEKCTDADRLLVTLDGLPRLLAALSGVHEDIWAGATIDDAIEAATQYFQTRFKDTDICAELDRLEDTLNDMVDRLAAMRVTVFGE